MNEYTIGSVADLISSRKFLEVKAEKERFKNEEQALKNAVIKKRCNKKSRKFSFRSSETECKHSNKVTCPSTGKDDIETANKNENSIPLKMKKELMLRKRKKAVEKPNLNATNNCDASKSKKQKIHLADLNNTHIESKKKPFNREEIPKQENKFPGKQKIFDFNENTIFVGNIPISYDTKKICRMFCKFGEIQSARIRCVPVAEINMNKKVAAIKKQFNPKRNSLVAYVKYKSQDSATAALKANGMVVDGHHLRVDVAEENKNRDNNKAVFVGGLSFDIEDDELWEFFERCGKILSVRVIRDSQTSMGKGFGYVNFDSTASVELALQLDGHELKKRTVSVKRCVKARNKNKLNFFGRKKSKEIVNELLCKKGNKYKFEKKKFQKGNQFSTEFQGKMANMKQKKKKKLSKTALHQRKLAKILGAS